MSEYWIIDPVQGAVRFYRLVNGSCEPAALGGTVFRSRALAGFWIDVSWLLSDPLPNSYGCLQQILAS